MGPALFALSIQESILKARAAAEALSPGGIDFAAFFLDDGTVAGVADAVAKFVEVFSQEMASKGLTLSPSKCEVVPAAGAATSVGRQAFPGFQWLEDRNFKLLGAPFGSRQYCEDFAKKRAAKAVTLLEAIRGCDDVQGLCCCCATVAVGPS